MDNIEFTENLRKIKSRNGLNAFFHKWGTNDEGQSVAIIEDEKGHVFFEHPWEIRFVDSF